MSFERQQEDRDEARRRRESISKSIAQKKRGAVGVKKIRKTEKTTKSIELPKRGAAAPPLKGKTITDLANKLYGEANLPTISDQKQAVKDLGISGARQKFKPKNVNEVKARLGLAIVEPIIGGIDEATFGLTSSQSASRPATQQLRILGAIATPTAADAVAGWVLAKAGATRIGKSALKKMNKYLLDVGDPIFPKLTAAELDEVRQWEKLGGGLTNLRRTAKKSPKILNSIEEISDFYKKNPAQFSAGASFIPEEVFIFQNLANEYDFEIDELINFVQKNDDLFSDGTIITGLLPTLSKKDKRKLLGATTTLPSKQINKIINKIDTTYFSKTDLDALLDQLPEIRELEETKIFDITKPDEKVIPDTDHIPKTVPKTTLDEPVIPIEEPVPVDEVIGTPPLGLPKTEVEARRQLTLTLRAGKKETYRVSYKGEKSFTFEARSFPDAMQKGQRIRTPTKKLPKSGELVRIRE